MSLEESLLVMEVMDKMRMQSGFTYPESLEDVEDKGPYLALASLSEN